MHCRDMCFIKDSSTVENLSFLDKSMDDFGMDSRQTLEILMDFDRLFICLKQTIFFHKWMLNFILTDERIIII
jgi:hypothetical protein